jgi:glycosyltransferase involved in cell wall biosynthesis
MQRRIMQRRNVLTLLISNRLHAALGRHHGATPLRSLVLHDAAPSGIALISGQRRESLRQLWQRKSGITQPKAIHGYFGSLFPGRGVEIIEALAKSHGDHLFLLFGGTEEELQRRREENRHANLCYMGFLPHAEVRDAMMAMDVLLMPYQEKVSIGVEGHDTADWMSPIKMFEYMASNVPIIASRLPALEEVLSDNVNALLASAADPSDWSRAIVTLTQDASLSGRLARSARESYEREYNWRERASRLLESLLA